MLGEARGFNKWSGKVSLSWGLGRDLTQVWGTVLLPGEWRAGGLDMGPGVAPEGTSLLHTEI